jgi:hypothetical protein
VSNQVQLLQDFATGWLITISICREAFPELDAYEGNVQKPDMQETRQAGTAERRAQLAEERKGELKDLQAQ